MDKYISEYQNLPNEEEDWDFPSDDEFSNQEMGLHEPQKEENSVTTVGNSRSTTGSSEKSNSFNSHQQNKEWDDSEQGVYEEPSNEFLNIQSKTHDKISSSQTAVGNSRSTTAPSGKFNSLNSHQQNEEWDDSEQGVYEEPSNEILNEADSGVSASTLERPSFFRRGPSNLPPPLVGQHLPAHASSHHRPSLFNLSVGNVSHRQTGPSLVGPRLGKINPLPFQLPPRHGNVHSLPKNFGSPKSFVQDSKIRLVNRPQLHSGLIHNVLPHIRQTKPNVNDSSTRPLPRTTQNSTISPLTSQKWQKSITNDSNTQSLSRTTPNSATSPLTSQKWQKSITNIQSPLPPALPKPLPNFRLQTPNPHQFPKQRQVNPWSIEQKAQLLVNTRPPFTQGNWRKPSTQNINRPPLLPTASKPLSTKNFSSISSTQHKEPIDYSSNENVEPSKEYLQLNSGEKIPMTVLYKTLLNEEYFHPITKDSTHKYLEDGTYLLRPSTSHTDEKPITLVLKHNGKTFIFSVEKRENGLYSIGAQKEGELAFSTVQELIAYYHDNSFHFEGQETYLLNPAKKESL